MAGPTGAGGTAAAAGPLNHLLDVAGLSVGHAGSERFKTGVTVVLPAERAVASVAVVGSAPGTRETDLLAPERTVDRIDALVLGGGSAFGLAAADGVQARLAGLGRGLRLADAVVPLVPAAVIFDLPAGGERPADRGALHRTLGEAAADAALAGGGPEASGIGTVGAGIGATAADLKGGLGSASAVVPLAGGTATVAAMVAVNPVGAVTYGSLPHFRAGAFEIGGEFGGLGPPPAFPEAATVPVTKAASRPGTTNTVIAVLATDARLTKAEAARLARSAHDGIALAVWPAHTPMDGDTVFCLATGHGPAAREPSDGIALCAAASAALARGIARGVHDAAPAPHDRLPTWRMRAGMP